MKGDYTRFTFKPEKHYNAVRRQQGRVDVDPVAGLLGHLAGVGVVDEDEGVDLVLVHLLGLRVLLRGEEGDADYHRLKLLESAEIVVHLDSS